MRRGFSTLELMIALAVTAGAIIAATQLTLGLPAMLENAHLEQAAYAEASALLAEAERAAFTGSSGVSARSSTTRDGIEVARHVEPIYDELAARAIATASWRDTNGPRQVSFETLIIDHALARDLSCSPFLSGDWSRPRIIATHLLAPGGLLPPESFTGTYPVASLAALGTSLAVTSGSTASATSSSLFFFTFGEEGALHLAAAFDNTPVSRVGYHGIAVGGGHAYAANGFGSASAATCAQDSSCAQLHLFDMRDPAAPTWVSSLQLAVAEPPYARTVGGATAAAKSVSYRRGYVYLGLEKTSLGSEFNVIDVRDPAAPQWVGGLRIGRSVEAVAVTRTHAYLATSDPGSELVVVDIRDPEQPAHAGSWNAPGRFGTGSSVSVRGNLLYFGRSYTSDGAELMVLDVSDPASVTLLAQEDIGTAETHAGAQGSMIRDPVAAVLAGNMLRFWHADGTPLERPSAEPLHLAGKGVSLACTGDLLIVGGSDPAGGGFLQVISGS